MLIYPNQKLAIIIDGNNLYATAKNLEFEIDYIKLLNLFKSKGQFVRGYYFTLVDESQDIVGIRPLLDFLDYNGYSIRTKPTKSFTDNYGNEKIKGSMHVEIAVTMMELTDSIDHFILFTGDGDFESLVEGIQKKGCVVSVVSTVKSRPPMVSDQLRRQADQFIDLYDLIKIVGSDKKR